MYVGNWKVPSLDILLRWHLASNEKIVDISLAVTLFVDVVVHTVKVNRCHNIAVYDQEQ